MRFVAAFVLVLAGLVGGCGLAVQNYTRPVDHGPRSAAADTGTLIIARVTGSPELVTIIDANGKVVGQLAPDTWLRLTLAPGHYRFYSIFANVSAWSSLVDVEVTPGRVYYASVTRMAGMWAVAPRHADRFPHREQFIAGGHEVEFDPSREAQLAVELPLSSRQEAIARANHGFQRFDERKRKDFMLLADDGIAQAGVAP